MIRPPFLAVILAVLLFATACTGERPTLSNEVPGAEIRAEEGVEAGVTEETVPDLTAVDGERAGQPVDESAGAGHNSSDSPPATLAGLTTEQASASSELPFGVGELPAIVNDGVARAVRTTSGVVADVISEVDGGYLILTPCANEVVVADVEVLSGAHVVLDAGHGGSEPGAVGPQGTRESDLNLEIARRVEVLLREAGVTVVQTRSDDYRISIVSRTAIATALQPEVFVSIHHNAAPDGPMGKPGAETYYQVRDPESKRLAGLVYEEALDAFSDIDIEWAGDTDAGAKTRLGESGDDYYGVLRRSEGVPATLTELLYLSNPPEEQLLLTPEFQDIEARVITRAILRFLTTQDPGSGFVESYPRTAPAGGGGGTGNCTDPAFG